jgi:hypothetical protein
MIDLAVERQYADTKELLALWQEFHNYFTMGVKGENLTHDKEAHFLDLKSRIAMLHDSFMDALTHDQNIGQEVLNIITRTITLKHLNRQSTGDTKKMEIEWHESYLLLNETVAALEDKRTELANLSGAQYRASRAAGAASQRFTSVLTSGYTKIAVITAVVSFATIGVQVLGIFDWNSAANITALQTPYRMFKAIYRATINPDSPWTNITVSDGDREALAAWPAGVKAPEPKSEQKDVVLGKLPPVAGCIDVLRGATEYRLEVTKKDMEGEVEIHAFLLPSATQARDVVDKWEKFVESPQGKNFKGQAIMIRSVNVVTLLKGTNSGFVNAMKVMVYRTR